jgi:murein L,D-transpeptidase YafK
LKPGRHYPVVGALSALLLLAVASPADAQLARELGLLPAEAGVAAPARIAALPTESSFALEQLRHDRVRDARIATRHNIKRLFHERGIRYPAADIFMRIFKRERSLELWVRSEGADQFALLKTYPICALAGELGPKRRQGDNQVPEGFYFINFFNPRSDFHLSLHVDYPNRRDRAAGAEGVKLGGDIYIHGGCSSEGCLALTDDGIREVYWLSVEARAAGQRQIPVHIFPARLDNADFDILRRTFAHRPDLGRFWATLKPGYDYFEQHRRLPAVAVDGYGEYAVNGASLDEPRPLGDPASAGAAPRPLGAPTAAGAEPRPLGASAPAGVPVTPPAVRPAGPRPLGTPVNGG